jgi:hypothetical protein
MPWPGVPLRIALLLLVATVGPPGVRSEGNVGKYRAERCHVQDSPSIMHTTVVNIKRDTDRIYI